MSDPEEEEQGNVDYVVGTFKGDFTLYIVVVGSLQGFFTEHSEVKVFVLEKSVSGTYVGEPKSPGGPFEFFIAMGGFLGGGGSPFMPENSMPKYR